MNVGYILDGHGEDCPLELRCARMGTYAGALNLTVTEWVVEGENAKARRKLNAVIKNLKRGDNLFVEDVTVLGESMRDIVDMLAKMLRKGVGVYGVTDCFSFDNIDDSRSFLMALDCAVSIYSRMYSNRTKAALVKKKKDGVTLGRPSGTFRKMSVLMSNRGAISRAIKEGVPYSEICRRYKVSYSTFRRFQSLTNGKL